MTTKKKRRSQVPRFILWSKFDQRRFTDSMEKMTGLVNDLAATVQQLELKLHALEAKKSRKTKTVNLGSAVE